MQALRGKWNEGKIGIGILKQSVIKQQTNPGQHGIDYPKF
jgi:hypothetical protein